MKVSLYKGNSWFCRSLEAGAKAASQQGEALVCRVPSTGVCPAPAVPYVVFKAAHGELCW